MTLFLRCLYFLHRGNAILGLFEAGQTNSSKPSLLSGQEQSTISGASILSDLENHAVSTNARVSRRPQRRLRILIALMAAGSVMVLLYVMTSRLTGADGLEQSRTDVAGALATNSARTDLAQELPIVPPSLVPAGLATIQAVAEDHEDKLAANLPGLSALIVNEQVDAPANKISTPQADAALNELVTMSPDLRVAPKTANAAVQVSNNSSRARHVSNAQKKRLRVKANVHTTKIAAATKSSKKSAVPPKSRTSDADSDVTLIAAIVAHDNAVPVAGADKSEKSTNAKKIEDERKLKSIEAQ